MFLLFLCPFLPLFLFFCQEMFPGYLILSLGPPLTQLGLWREARILIRPSSALHRRQSRTVSLRQCCLSKQQNKSTSGLCSFYLSLTYCCGSTDGAERPPSALMMTNEQADEISWWPYWDVKTREEFMCRDFYETSGERVITNEYTRLIVRSLPWKQYHCESCHVPCL